jgi:hypothetical protein
LRRMTRFEPRHRRVTARSGRSNAHHQTPLLRRLLLPAAGVRSASLWDSRTGTHGDLTADTTNNSSITGADYRVIVPKRPPRIICKRLFIRVSATLRTNDSRSESSGACHARPASHSRVDGSIKARPEHRKCSLGRPDRELATCQPACPESTIEHACRRTCLPSVALTGGGRREPRVPDDVRNVALAAEPAISLAPGKATLSWAAGCNVGTEIMAVLLQQEFPGSVVRGRSPALIRLDTADRQQPGQTRRAREPLRGLRSPLSGGDKSKIGCHELVFWKVHQN